MNKVTTRVRRALVTTIATVVAILVIAPATASATDTQVIQVSGSFNINQTTCPDFPDDPLCTSGDFTGDITGLNQLIQTSIRLFPDPEFGPYATYTDYTQIDSQYGTFIGTEYGFAEAVSETEAEFNSLSRLTGPCDSKLTLHNSGSINLVDSTSVGTYSGVLVLRSC